MLEGLPADDPAVISSSIPFGPVGISFTPRALAMLGVLLAALVAGLDWLTGVGINLNILYVIPTLMLTRGYGGRVGVVASLLTSVVSLGTVIAASGGVSAVAGTEYFNHFVRFSMLVLVAIIYGRQVVARARLAEQTVLLQASLATIKRLGGILPICSFCKRIRNPEGHWMQIEVFVRDNSDADFSHGFCPECGAKHYPEEAS